MVQLMGFRLDGQQYALHLDRVNSVVRATNVSVLPKAPDIVKGVINFHGRIVPVINVRRRFNLPERGVALSDMFILAHTARHLVCLIVDAVNSVVEYPEQSIEKASRVLPNLEYVAGVLKMPEGVVFIHDLDRFLSLEEEASLEKALA